MVIPNFDGILNVLPPHTGDPSNPSDLSPFPCEIEEFCDRFSTSPKRKLVLTGLLAFRSELHSMGIKGFQWLDGSFLEDIESQEGRDPGDIDVVTFVDNPIALEKLLRAKPYLLVRKHVKETFHVDHFWLSLGSSPRNIVEHTRYWTGLFSHRRDGVWKGMVAVELNEATQDQAAQRAMGVQP